MNKDFWKDFDKLFVGVDQLFENANSLFDGTSAYVSTYPPYNIYKSDDGYRIELAVAGYSIDDIEVLVDNKTLTITGNKGEAKEKSSFSKVLHMGLARRSFTKKFMLSQVVDRDSIDAEIKNGILTITLKNLPAQDEKSRKIKIKG